MKIRVVLEGMGSFSLNLAHQEACTKFRQITELLLSDDVPKKQQVEEKAREVLHKAQTITIPEAAITPEEVERLKHALQSSPIVVTPVPKHDEVATEVAVTKVETALQQPLHVTSKLPSSPVTEPEKDSSPTFSYKGFMYIKCLHCGKFHGYFIKEPMDYYVCRECTKSFRFKESLSKLYLDCACGNHIWYRTNLGDFAHEIACPRCNALVDVKFNQDTGDYVTIP